MALTKAHFRMIDGSAVNVKDFGAVGDGVTDDTAAIQAALDSGLTSVFFPEGTYKITSKITISADDLRIYGNSTILCAIADDYAFSSSNNTRLSFLGITFDGNHTAKGGISCFDVTYISLENCVFDDFRTATYVYAIEIGGCEDLYISNCTFNKLWAVDGTGDNGVIRAIYLYSSITKGVIESCKFTDINNVTSSDVLSYQDADAIQCYVNPATSPEPIQNINIVNCYFENCGKRAVKFQGQENSVYTFENSRVISSWTSGDSNSLVGMYSVFSHYGGSVTAYNVTLKDGCCIYFVDGQVADQVYLRIDGCYFSPESHITVRGEKVQAVLLDDLNVLLKTTITNNFFKNIERAVYEARDLTFIGNQVIHHLTTGSASVYARGGYAIISNNVLYSPDTNGQGIYFFDNGMSGFIVSGNHITGFQDSIYLTVQSGTTYGAVVGNVCTSYGRQSVFNGFNYNNNLVSANYQNGEPRDESISIQNATSSNIADASSSINTINKREGKMVYDTTNNRIMISSGSVSTSVWHIADGSGSVTPS